MQWHLFLKQSDSAVKKNWASFGGFSEESSWKIQSWDMENTKTSHWLVPKKLQISSPNQGKLQLGKVNTDGCVWEGLEEFISQQMRLLQLGGVVRVMHGSNMKNCTRELTHFLIVTVMDWHQIEDTSVSLLSFSDDIVFHLLFVMEDVPPIN
ncbi:hypothetical protein PTKIN_Ptkin09bG0283600 [Pterospermum kingtungense]